MGQYHYVVNLDKRQYLHPHCFGDGLKLMEFGCSRDGTMTALAVLLAEQNGRGGGDINSQDPLVGSWAGDRIAIVGDYAEPKDKVGWDAEAAMPESWTPSEAPGAPIYALCDAEGSAWEELSPRMHALFAAAGEHLTRRNW